MLRITGSFVALLLLPRVAVANEPDWQALSHVEVIEVVTRDEDGDLRDRPVWFVEVDGAIYLRSSGSRWIQNLRRDPELLVRIEGVEYPLRAVEVSGDEMVAAVDAASAEKYGWQNSVITFFRQDAPDLMRLEPR